MLVIVHSLFNQATCYDDHNSPATYKVPGKQLKSTTHFTKSIHWQLPLPDLLKYFYSCCWPLLTCQYCISGTWLGRHSVLPNPEITKLFMLPDSILHNNMERHIIIHKILNSYHRQTTSYSKMEKMQNTERSSAETKLATMNDANKVSCVLLLAKFNSVACV
jgi:hypothetical protein